jgi:hypothetical protein
MDITIALRSRKIRRKPSAPLNNWVTLCVSGMAGSPRRNHRRPPFRNSARRDASGLWVAEDSDSIVGFGFS